MQGLVVRLLVLPLRRCLRNPSVDRRFVEVGYGALISGA